MGVPSSPLPTLGGDNLTEDPKIRTALQELQGILTGAVDDSNLESPDSAVPRVIHRAAGAGIGGGSGAGTYALREGDLVLPAAGSDLYIVPLWIADAAEFAVAGKTTQIRLVANVAVNSVAPGITFTFGLRAISAMTGASGSGMTFTFGSDAATVAVASPAAGGATRNEGSWVTMPASGAHCILVVTSGAMGATTTVGVTATVEMRHI